MRGLINSQRMTQQSVAEAIAEAVRHSTGNRREIEASKYAGCLSCCAKFKANEVVDWKDEWISPEKQNRVHRWTAECPLCGEPTVIGSASGLLEQSAYLPVLNGFLKDQATKRR